jgi:hypothetical protein
MEKWYEKLLDDKVLALLCLTLIAICVIFSPDLTDLQITVIVGVVSGIGGLAVGKALK